VLYSRVNAPAHPSVASRPQASDLCCLCRSHIGSASGQAWKEGKMDFTGAQMVLTLKLISVAVCYQDGLKEDKVGPGGQNLRIVL